MPQYSPSSRRGREYTKKPWGAKRGGCSQSRPRYNHYSPPPPLHSRRRESDDDGRRSSIPTGPRSMSGQFDGPSDAATLKRKRPGEEETRPPPARSKTPETQGPPPKVPRNVDVPRLNTSLPRSVSGPASGRPERSPARDPRLHQSPLSTNKSLASPLLERRSAAPPPPPPPTQHLDPPLPPPQDVISPSVPAAPDPPATMARRSSTSRFSDAPPVDPRPKAYKRTSTLEPRPSTSGDTIDLGPEHLVEQFTNWNTLIVDITLAKFNRDTFKPSLQRSDERLQAAKKRGTSGPLLEELESQAKKCRARYDQLSSRVESFRESLGRPFELMSKAQVAITQRAAQKGIASLHDLLLQTETTSMGLDRRVTELEELTPHLKGDDEDVRKINSTLSTLKEELQTFRTQLDRTSRSEESQSSDVINNLNLEVAVLREDNKRLTTDHSNISSANRKLTSELSTLRSDHKQLVKIVSNIQTDQAKLFGLSKDTATKCESMKTEYIPRSEFTALQNKINELKTESKQSKSSASKVAAKNSARLAPDRPVYKDDNDHVEDNLLKEKIPSLIEAVQGLQKTVYGDEDENVKGIITIFQSAIQQHDSEISDLVDGNERTKRERDEADEGLRSSLRNLEQAIAGFKSENEILRQEQEQKDDIFGSELESLGATCTKNSTQLAQLDSVPGELKVARKEAKEANEEAARTAEDSLRQGNIILELKKRLEGLEDPSKARRPATVNQSPPGDLRPANSEQAVLRSDIDQIKREITGLQALEGQSANSIEVLNEVFENLDNRMKSITNEDVVKSMVYAMNKLYPDVSKAQARMDELVQNFSKSNNTHAQHYKKISDKFIVYDQTLQTLTKASETPSLPQQQQQDHSTGQHHQSAPTIAIDAVENLVTNQLAALRDALSKKLSEQESQLHKLSKHVGKPYTTLPLNERVSHMKWADQVANQATKSDLEAVQTDVRNCSAVQKSQAELNHDVRTAMDALKDDVQRLKNSSGGGGEGLTPSRNKDTARSNGLQPSVGVHITPRRVGLPRLHETNDGPADDDEDVSLMDASGGSSRGAQKEKDKAKALEKSFTPVGFSDSTTDDDDEGPIRAIRASVARRKRTTTLETET